jgi:nickel transport protein
MASEASGADARAETDASANPEVSPIICFDRLEPRHRKNRPQAGSYRDVLGVAVGARLRATRLLRWIALIALLWIGSCVVSPAWAHRLQVFAAANGELIEGSAYFAGGAPASGVDVLIEDANGDLLAELSPAADGSFHYRTTAPVEHVVVARSGDGHRAEWVVRAAELAPAFDVPAVDPSAAAAGPVLEATGPQPPVPGPISGSAQVSDPPAQDVTLSAANPSGIDAALTAAIELAVARQLRPLREELAAARATAGLRDVLGGIGYIIGLAGLALWWRARGADSGVDNGSAPGRSG